MFTPNWQLLGLKSKEEGMIRVFKFLVENADKLTSHSFTKEAVFQYGGQMITIIGKKKKRKEDK